MRHLPLVLLLGCPSPPDDAPPPTEPPSSTTTPPTAPPDFVVERPVNETCRALPRPRPATSIAFEQAFGKYWVDDYDIIIDLAPIPSDPDAWFMALRSGTVVRFTESQGATKGVDVLDLSDRIEWHIEGGLLGLAPSPDFANDGALYVFYTTNDARRVSRFVSADGGQTFGSETVVLEMLLGYGFHVAGDLAFDPAGALLVSLGDGGDFFTAATPWHPAGKVLRIDPNGNAGLAPTTELRVRNYGIPDDNPVVAGGLPEIYAYGLRNPYRMTADPATGDVWVGDVGEDGWEEANRLVPGGHHGWPAKEGLDCFLEDPCDDPTYVDPVVVYPRSEGVSIIGGHVYRGKAVPGLAGAYLFNEWTTNEVWGAFTDDEGAYERRFLAEVPTTAVTWGQGHDGEVYAAGFTIYRVIEGGSPAVPFPQKLSETGCMVQTDPSVPASGLIPYVPQVELWSDGAAKRRWMALPEDDFVTVEDDGHWSLPIGSVLVKEFEADGVRVETRLMMRHDDGGWGFYTYRWDEDGADATLVTTGSSVDTGSRRWEVPSRAQCLQCHTEASQRTLGLETPQLNHDADLWGVGRANQVEVFRRMGILSKDPGAPKALPAHPALTDETEPLDERARAYLDVQCASCHQPESTAPTALDLRWDTPLADTEACDVLPSDGSLGLDDARVIAPGAPERSVLVERMRRTDAERMPQIGTVVVDPQGTSVVTEWVRSLSVCP